MSPKFGSTITITWTNTHKKARNMDRLADRVSTRHVQRWGAEVAEIGEESVRESVLDGGINKTKKGGARIEFGDMIGSVNSTARFSDGMANVRAGFIDGPPKQTIWQERGTRGSRIKSANPRTRTSKAGASGIPAMLAIPLAEQTMKVGMEYTGYKMLAQIAKEWDSTV